MKHFRTLITIPLTMILSLTGLVFYSMNGNIDVAAAEVVCSANLPYEVSRITGQNTYNVNACYATLAEAQTAMNNLAAVEQNVVIRHPSSFSPSKIIAMDRGIAASYQFRSDSSGTTKLCLSSSVPTGCNDTYIENHREMQYLGTIGFNAATGTGVIKIKVSGFIGYIDIKNSDLIPMNYLENAWSITLGGTTTIPDSVKKAQGCVYPTPDPLPVPPPTVCPISSYKEAPFSLVPRMNKYTVTSETYTDINGSSKDTRIIGHEYFNMWRGYSEGYFKYGPAPEWLPNGTYYSWDGITFYTDRDCRNPVYNGKVIGRYYQYFQYLPLPSDTKYTGAEIEAFVAKLGFTKAPTPESPGGSLLYGQGANFIASQTAYGINALLVFSLACHESTFGTSPIALAKYNMFGWGAVDSNPFNGAEAYASIVESINKMMNINIRWYLDPGAFVFFGSDLGSKNSGMSVKYASDPYWAEKIAGHAYMIDRWLGSKDINSINYAIMNDGTALGIERTEGVDTTDLYTLRNSLKDQSIILIPGNRVAGSLWAKTPTTIPLDSFGFIPLANYTYMVPKLVDGGSYLVETFGWNTNKLSIAGYGFVNGYNLPLLRDANHFLTLTSAAVPSVTSSIPLGDGALNEQLKTTIGQGIVMYDGTTYSSPNVDLTALELGSYTLGISVTEPNYGIEAGYPFNYAGTLPANQIINGKIFAFERLTDGNIKLNVSHVILFAPYTMESTKQNITINATVNPILPGWTISSPTHTFTENGSFTFTITDGLGGSIDRIATITNIDKTPPVITIAPYPTGMQPLSITVTASTNEGTLNATSHVFQNNGSFDFVATDAAGNVTTQNVTITNIQASYAVNFSVVQGQGTLGAMAGTSTLKNGEYLTPGSNVILNVVPTAGYVVSQWTVDGVSVASNLTNTLTVSNLNASVTVGVSLTMFGDVNNDGKLTTTDIVMLRRYLAGLDTLSDLGKLSGDYNNDGKISTTDIVMMRRKLAGLE